jgi:hypothetical protein
MGVVLAPLATDNVGAWKEWAASVTGPRKAEFEEFNRRNGLTKHEAWLCETPMGTVICAIHEGPGAAELMPKLARSTHAFDKEFVGFLAKMHGMDLHKPPPGPMPVKVIG